MAHESIQILTTESFYKYIIRIRRNFEISLAFICKVRNPTYLLFLAKICIILQEMIDSRYRRMIKRLNNLSNTKDRNKRITFLLEDHIYVPRKKKKKKEKSALQHEKYYENI